MHEILYEQHHAFSKSRSAHRLKIQQAENSQFNSFLSRIDSVEGIQWVLCNWCMLCCRWEFVLYSDVRSIDVYH